eukprot:13472392-Alexandrium_andersonii.AAC.1
MNLAGHLRGMGIALYSWTESPAPSQTSYQEWTMAAEAFATVHAAEHLGYLPERAFGEVLREVFAKGEAIELCEHWARTQPDRLDLARFKKSASRRIKTKAEGRQ